MTGPFPFPTRYLDEVDPPGGVHPTEFYSTTDPALDSANHVRAGKRWRKTDNLTTPTWFEVYVRNAANSAWILERAWVNDTYAVGEVPVADADGRLAPGTVTPGAHAVSHEDGGDDELDVTTLAGFPGGGTTFLRDDGTFAAPPGGSGTVDIEDEGSPEGAADTIDFTGAGVSVSFAGGVATVDIPGGGGAHATDHENGGGDEIDLTGLSGVPAVLPDPSTGDDDDVLQVQSGVYVLAPSPSSGALPAWLTNHPDASPSSPNAADDEFDDSTNMSGPINGLDAKWSWQNQQSSTLTYKHGRVVLVAGATSQNIMLQQTLAAPTGDYEYTAKMWMASSAEAFRFWGVMLRESSTGKVLVVGGDNSNGSTEFRLMCRSYTGDAGGSTNQGAAVALNVNSGLMRPYYFRVRKVSTTINYEWSISGTYWRTILSASESTHHTTRPDQVGFAHNEQGGVGNCGIIIEWFRKTA